MSLASRRSTRNSPSLSSSRPDGRDVLGAAVRAYPRACESSRGILSPGVKTRADEHHGFVELVIRDGIVTLADVKPCEMQQRIGDLDRSLPAPIEHEASSHRQLGTRKIAMVLVGKSAG